MKETVVNNHAWSGAFVRHMLMTVMSLVLLGLAACGEKEDAKESDSPETPVTPVTPSNGTTVPVTGGTITKGDITLTFSSGTFTEDTEVAVTEVTKGEAYGEFEASKFYQLTLPAKIDRPIEVKIKCNIENGSLLGVLIESGLRKSMAEETTHSIYLEGTYDSGEYTCTIPTTQNNKDDEASTVKIGLINVSEDSSAQTRAVKPASKFLVIQGKVENIEWYYDMYNFEYMLLSRTNKNKLTSYFGKINGFISDALTKIHDLGFKIETSRKIPFIFTTLNLSKDHFGAFVQSPSDDKESSIELHLTKVLTNESDKSLSQTIIHELLHYFQADYDPRSPKKKCGGAEENVICEAASVWAEQFMNNGKLNGEFVEQYLQLYVRSMDNIDELRPNTINSFYHPFDWKAAEIKRHAEHGYAMSTLLYYLTNPMSEMEAFDIDKKSIVEIFKLWKTDNAYVGHTFLPFEKWLDNHGSGFLMTDDFNDYLLALLTGKIIDKKIIDIDKLGGGNQPILKIASLNNSDKVEFSDDCLSHGCRICKISITQRGSLKGKDIVVKQMKPDVQTYLIVRDQNMNDELFGRKAVEGDSIVVKGETIDNVLNGTKKSYLYLVTINHQNSKLPYHATCEIVDNGVKVSPDSLSYSANGGEQSTFISNYEGYGYYGASVRSEGHGWCGVALTSTIGEVKIIVQPNETTKKRECIVDCYVYANSSTPESEWVKIPVKVTQAAGSGGGDSGVENITRFLGIELDAKVMTNVLLDGKPYEKAYLREKRGAYLKYDSYDSANNDSKWNVTGTIINNTVRVTVTGVKSSTSLSFSIEGFNGGDGPCKVSNLEYKYGSETSGDYVKFKAHGVPGDSHKAGVTRVYFWMEGTEADGVSIDEYYERDVISTADSRAYEHSYKTDASNKVFLKVDFMRGSGGSSRGLGLPVTPGKPSAPAGSGLQRRVNAHI